MAAGDPFQIPLDADDSTSIGAGNAATPALSAPSPGHDHEPSRVSTPGLAHRLNMREALALDHQRDGSERGRRRTSPFRYMNKTVRNSITVKRLKKIREWARPRTMFEGEFTFQEMHDIGDRFWACGRAYYTDSFDRPALRARMQSRGLNVTYPWRKAAMADSRVKSDWQIWLGDLFEVGTRPTPQPAVFVARTNLVGDGIVYPRYE